MGNKHDLIINIFRYTHICTYMPMFPRLKCTSVLIIVMTVTFFSEK